MPRWQAFEPYFWSLVDKNGPVPEHCPEVGNCWLWKGDVSKRYGRVCFRGGRTGAHRVAFILTSGEIPVGLLICHHCDNRLCVRPSHLFAGTSVDNMQDWTKKGRNKLINDPPRGDEHWTRRKTWTSYELPWSRLTLSDVVAIRGLHATGVSFVDIAKRYGVSRQTATRAALGETYR